MRRAFHFLIFSFTARRRASLAAHFGRNGAMRYEGLRAALARGAAL